MQKSTFSVNFFVRRTRQGKNGETPIIMRITVNGRYAELTPSAKYQYRNGIKADVVLQAKVLWLRR